MASRHWLYFGGFVFTGLLTAGAGLMAILDALSVLSRGVFYGGEFVLLVMLGEAAEWIAVALVLGLVAAAFLVATVVSVLRNASLPRSDRLASVVGRLERRYPLLEQFDVSETVEPTREDRKQQLKERYVAGEVSDEEFERRMQQVLDDGSTETGTPTGDYAVDRENRTR